MVFEWRPNHRLIGISKCRSPQFLELCAGQVVLSPAGARADRRDQTGVIFNSVVCERWQQSFLPLLASYVLSATWLHQPFHAPVSLVHGHDSGKRHDFILIREVDSDYPVGVISKVLRHVYNDNLANYRGVIVCQMKSRLGRLLPV